MVLLDLLDALEKVPRPPLQAQRPPAISCELTPFSSPLAPPPNVDEGSTQGQ